MSAGGLSRRGLEVFLLALIAVAIVWVLSLRPRRPAVEPAPEIGVPTEFGRVISIELLSDGDTVAIARRGAQYWIERPIRDRADIFFVEELLRQASGLRAERALPDTAGEAYGLRPPRGFLRLRSAQGHVWGLWIGDETPVGAQRYARRAEPGSPVVLVESFAVGKYFLPKLAELRDPAAVSLGAGPPDSIAVLVPGRELRARRTGPEGWQARTPPGLDLDATRINAVVQLLRGPNLIGFPPRELEEEPMGLVSPRATWVLFQGARQESVRLGRTAPDLRSIYVRPAGRRLPALLSAEQYRAIVDGWPGLADRRLLSLAPDSVLAIDFLGGPANGYRREADRWIRRPGGRDVARREALETDLANLARLQWRTWPTRELLPPPGAPRLRLRLASATAAETLHLASAGDSLVWARSTRRPLWGRVTETAWSTWKHRAGHAE